MKHKRAYLTAAFLLALSGALFLLCLYSTRSKKSFTVSDLRVDNRTAPKGIDISGEGFGWRISSDDDDVLQESYRICVAGSKEDLKNRRYIWDSGEVSSRTSTDIPYEGPGLEYEHEYAWSVSIRCRGIRGAVTCDSTFETGLSDSAFDDSTSKWIVAPAQAYPDMNEGDEFTINVTVRPVDDCAGIVWGYSDEDHGMYRMLLHIDREEHKALFDTQYIRKYMTEWEGETGETGLSDEEISKGVYELEISVKGKKAHYYINGEKACSVKLPSVRGSRLAFGLHHDRGKRAYIKELSVSDETGSILSESFADPLDTIFGEQPMYIEDGELCADGALLLTCHGSSAGSPAAYFRKEFDTDGQENIVSARLYATALGIYHPYINGERVSEEWLLPGNTAYNIRTDYQIFDVTGLIRQGENAAGFVLGHGWYDRAAGYDGTGAVWGDTNAVRGMLVITYESGKRDALVTDDGWSVCTDGPLRVNDLWQGEYYDARLDLNKDRDFSSPGYTEEPGLWKRVSEIDPPNMTGVIKAQEKPSVMNTDVLEGKALASPGRNMLVYDFGQEISGVCRIRVRGKEGDCIKIRHGEWLNEDDMLNSDGVPGSVYTKNLMGAQSIDTYILRGDGGIEEYNPTMTFHGFRYAELILSSEDIEVISVEALELSSLNGDGGYFSSSDETVNGYVRNAERSLISNSVSIPTDCPQRSERFGWTGDACVFSESALDLSDTGSYGFYKDYIKSILEVMDPDTGSSPDMAPRNFNTDLCGRGGNGGNNVWGDAVVVLPWRIYERFGSVSVLEEAYGGISMWIEYLVENSDSYIRPDTGYGDFMALDSEARSATNTAWSAYVCELAGRIAGILGKEDDEKRFAQYHEGFKKAFADTFITQDGRPATGAQGTLVLGLYFDLIPGDRKGDAAAALNSMIGDSSYETRTGFAATPFVYQVLCDYGYDRTACEMLSKKGPEGLLYPVSLGATTCWELRNAYTLTQNGYTLDGSLNHPAFGSAVHFLFEYTAGIRLEQKNDDDGRSGFFVIEPHPDTFTGDTEGVLDTVYGEAKVEYHYDADKETIVYCIDLPANTEGIFRYPSSDKEIRISSGHHEF